MNDEKRYPILDEEDGSSLTASEPVSAMPLGESRDRQPVDYNFGFTDFGYPHTIDELNVALDDADAHRNDPSHWVSSVELHTRLEGKYPWLK